MTPFITELLVKVTIVLVAAILVTAALRALAPVLRHTVLLGALGTCLVLPVLIAVSPQLQVALLPPASVAASPAAPGTIDANTLASLATPRTVSASESTSPVGAIGRQGQLQPTPATLIVGRGGLTLLPIIWLGGFIAVLGWLVIGRLRLDHIAGMSWPLTDADWSKILDEERAA